MSNLEHFLENGLALIENGVQHDEFINIMSSDPNKPYVELSAEGLWKICVYIFYRDLPDDLRLLTPLKLTNVDIIKRLSTRDIAPLLIKTRNEPEYDYDYEENLIFSGFTNDIYVTSDGEEFGHLNYSDAIEHEVWWLEQGVIEEMR